MTDGVLTLERFHKMIAAYGRCNCNAAATRWIKYRPDSCDIAQPRVGEWCLWSVVTRFGREYFAGKLADDGQIWLDWGATLRLTDPDQTYFARVRHLESEE